MELKSKKIKINDKEIKIKKVYRDTDEGIIGGVCASIAKEKGWNLTATRILTVIISSWWGLGIVPYVLLWMMMPSDENKED